MRNVENKVFIVTGSANGIGRELVLQLAEKRAHVAVVDIDYENLIETLHLVKKYPVSVSAHIVIFQIKKILWHFLVMYYIFMVN